MTINLPQPVAAYFAAESLNGEAVSRCFAERAVVKDEGHTYHGRAAIEAWKEEASSKYQYTSELLGCEHEGDRVVVTSRLTGNFPGSPVDLRYRFELAGEQIASLEIAP